MSKTKEINIQVVKIEKDDCAKCVAIQPILEKVMKEFSLNYNKLNISTTKDTLGITAGITDVPALVIYRNNERFSIVTGLDEYKIRTAINSAMHT